MSWGAASNSVMTRQAGLGVAAVDVGRDQRPHRLRLLGVRVEDLADIALGLGPVLAFLGDIGQESPEPKIDGAGQGSGQRGEGHRLSAWEVAGGDDHGDRIRVEPHGAASLRGLQQCVYGVFGRTQSPMCRGEQLGMHVRDGAVRRQQCQHRLVVAAMEGRECPYSAGL